MKKYFILLFLPFFLYPQKRIIIVDSITHIPVQYATVHLIKQNSVILTDSLGVFVKNKDSDFNVSCLGYKSWKSTTSVVIDTLFLQPSIIKLDEIVINSNTKPIELGFHNLKRKSIRIPFEYQTKNNVFYGTYIENNIKKECYIKELFFNVKSTDKKCIARIHLYSINESSTKTKRLNEILHENIILKINSKNSIKKIDIGNSKIILPENGVVLALELIENSESLNIGLGILKNSNSQNNFYVRPEDLSNPLSIKIGGNENLQFMFGISVVPY